MSLQHNDIGTKIIIVMTDAADAAVDVSGATAKQVWIERSDGTVVKRTADFTTDGTDGKIEYTTVSGDLTPAGRGEVQGYVILPTGTFHSRPDRVHIRRNAGDS